MTSRSEQTVTFRTFRFCVSTALAAGLLAGCAAGGTKPSKYAGAAQSALSGGNADKAVTLAEQAVAADPRNAAYRTLLGSAYLRAGRFESAAQAYDEAMELGEDGGKTALSLALADIALGRLPQAVDTLNTYRDSLPVSDYGLALAMAGQAQQGATILADALRRGENTPKLRQNLAYAYALDGRWREARVMAAIDVPAAELDARMQDWAGLGKPEDVRTRVASLLGVPVRGDAGQPQALALANFPAPEAAALAQVEASAAAAPQLAREAATELPAAPAAQSPAPALADASSAPVPSQLAAIDVPPSAPAAPAPAAPAATPFRVAGSYAAPVSAPAHRAAPVRVAPVPVANGSHVVQFGSFSSAEGAERAWRHFSKRNAVLAGYRKVIAQVTVRGRQFWRVQAAGFAGYGAASTMCGSVKARGGVCLVMAAPREVTPQGRAVETRMARRR